MNLHTINGEDENKKTCIVIKNVQAISIDHDKLTIYLSGIEVSWFASNVDVAIDEFELLQKCLLDEKP